MVSAAFQVMPQYRETCSDCPMRIPGVAGAERGAASLTAAIILQRAGARAGTDASGQKT